MKCWICGSEGDSGEHLVKSSDIKSVFPNITQDTPLVFSRSDGFKKKIGSRKANILKSAALICKHCNNNRTSSLDRAWEDLSSFLRRYPLEKRGPLKVRLSKVFKENRYKKVLAAHLFFVKIFGCRIKEYSVPIDLEPFSKSILNEEPNPYVFTHFKKAIGSNFKSVGLTEIDTDKDSAGNIVAAVWTYFIDELFVEISYSPKPAATSYLKNSFHPDWKDRVIIFQDYDVRTDEI